MGAGTQVFFGQFRGRAVLEAFINFVFQVAQHDVHQQGRFHFDLGRMYWFFVEKAGEQKPQQIGGDMRNGAPRWKVFPIEVIDPARPGIGSNQSVG